MKKVFLTILMMLATVVFYLFALNSNLDWWEGVIYVVGLIVFNVYSTIPCKG